MRYHDITMPRNADDREIRGQLLTPVIAPLKPNLQPCCCQGLQGANSQKAYLAPAPAMTASAGMPG